MMKKNVVATVLFVMAIVLIVAGLFSGCTQSEKVSHNISQQADAFNVQRKITVMNARTDTIMLELTGTFALQNSGANELEVICEVEDGVYQKHFIYLNEYTMYVVEDISNTNVSKYYYELNILPYVGLQVVPGVVD